jgi:Sec63 Brl domain
VCLYVHGTAARNDDQQVGCAYMCERHGYTCPITSKSTCVLVQVYISKGKVDSFSLIADMLYVGDNAPRIARALFEIALKNQWVSLVHDLLMVCLTLLHVLVSAGPGSWACLWHHSWQIEKVGVSCRCAR